MNENTNSKGKGLKTAGVIIAIIVIILLIGMIYYQNSSMIGKMDKILNQSSSSTHEIYDDTKVIEAYKNGSKEGLDEKEAFLYDTLNEVLGEIIKDDMTVYEKEKAAYDWVFGITHFQSDSLDPMSAGTSSDNYTPYGVIKGHNAICVGNATTFKLFMDALEIPCMIVHSTESGEHAWDVVQLDDDWYHVDVTFDGGSSKPSYSNFNLPDSMKDDGTWPYDHDVIPACKGTKYCYLFMNAKEADDMYSIPKLIAKARDKGKSYVPVIVKDTKGLNSTVAQFIANNILVENGEVYYEGVYSVEGKTILLYHVSKYDDDNSAVIPDDVMEKFTALFEKYNQNINPNTDY